MESKELDSVNEYFKHLGKISQEIDREEMARLWKLVKKGDQAAKHRIMEMNLRLVVPTAKRFQRPGMELMDLIEEGNLGLMQAIEKYEPRKGYRFSTYATYWIEQYVRRYIEEQSGAIKIPSHAWGNLKRWFRAWNELKEANGREPSLREMAEELNLTARQVASIMDTLSAAKGVDSLTSLVRDEDEMTLEEIISDDGKGNPHDAFVFSEDQKNVQQGLEDLDERDREIVALRYGLDDNSPKTLGEVAEMLGLSRERVRQIEDRAIRALRLTAQKAGLLEVAEENYRTTKLHAAMRPRTKTNILGEEIDDSPLAKLIRHKVAQAKKQMAQKKKIASKKKATHKKASKKVTKKALKRTAKKVAKKTVKKTSKKTARKPAKKVSKKR
ncbi:MAG: sigma-70 family RNA polymerase sigma factor [Elusimicrobiaceae bacterium]|nr:sigma-70 family RNA polymerase sigma factor [Elusimicrobiaceae bacterium]MBP5616541.1 sigma-70 family RNA polymerase sigma factor [Elusimicrobiaceae bacterium]